MKWLVLIVGSAIVGGVCGASIGLLTSTIVTEPLWPVAIWMLGTADGLIVGMAFCPTMFLTDRVRTVRDEFSNPIEAAFRFGFAAPFCGGVGGWIPGLVSVIANAALGVLLSECLKRYPPRSGQNPPSI